MKITHIRVESSAGPYSVVAGVGAIGQAAREIAKLGRFSSAHIVSSPQVWRAAGKTVKRGLRLSLRNALHLFNDAESAKHLGTVAGIARSLCRAGADRKSLIIAVGGESLAMWRDSQQPLICVAWPWFTSPRLWWRKWTAPLAGKPE